MSELKQCPFCGDTYIMIRKVHEGYIVGCNTLGCVCLHTKSVLFKTEEKAAVAWNRRSVQSDAVTASLEELINDYEEDGYFIVDGVNYPANELLNELKINSSVGEKFRKQIDKTIVQYFMKFGG